MVKFALTTGMLQQRIHSPTDVFSANRNTFDDVTLLTYPISAFTALNRTVNFPAALFFYVRVLTAAPHLS